MGKGQGRTTDRRARGPRVTVRGYASRWVPASFADVCFTARRRGTDAAEAIAAAGATYATLDRVLGGHGDVIAHRRTTSLVVREVQHDDPSTGRLVADGFEASRAALVRFAPVIRSGVALRAAAGVPDIGLEGPSFGIDPDDPAQADVRSAAAADALRAAEAYAAGLGLRVGPVLRAREPDERGGEPFPQPGRRALTAAAEAGGDDARLVDLVGEEVELVATIEVVVALV